MCRIETGVSSHRLNHRLWCLPQFGTLPQFRLADDVWSAVGWENMVTTDGIQRREFVSCCLLWVLADHTLMEHRLLLSLACATHFIERCEEVALCGSDIIPLNAEIFLGWLWLAIFPLLNVLLALEFQQAEVLVHFVQRVVLFVEGMNNIVFIDINLIVYWDYLFNEVHELLHTLAEQKLNMVRELLPQQVYLLGARQLVWHSSALGAIIDLLGTNWACIDRPITVVIQVVDVALARLRLRLLFTG